MTPNSFVLKNTVSLAPLSADHAEAMYRWVCDPLVRENLGIRREPSLERTHAWIAQALQDDSVCAFAILNNGVHVGNVILDRIDRYLSTARLSVYVGEENMRGSGLGRTGIYLALREAFDTLKLHKVWLTVHSRNTAAIHAYQRLGFQIEGVLRDEFILHDERIAALYMGVLEEDFRQLNAVWIAGD